VKNIRATLFFKARAICWKILNVKVYSIQGKISGQLCFSGQAQVAHNSWMYNVYSIQWKIPGHPLFFRASAGYSKLLNTKKYIFSTVNSGNPLFFTASNKLLKNSKCKKYIPYSEKFQGNSVFSGQARVTQNSWIIQNTCLIQWKYQGNSVFQGSASCSKILNVKSIFHTSKNFRATLFFRASPSFSDLLNV